MGKESTRRVFLTTVGVAGAVSLAGCSSLPGGGDDEPVDPEETDTPSTDNGTDNGGNGGNGGNAPGESVDDFSDLEGWEPDVGKLSSTTDDVFQGDQSVVLEPQGEGDSVVKITKTFYPDSLDLTQHDLSLAAKVKKPDLGSENSRMKIAVNVIAPSQSSMVTSIRQFPRDLSEWVRFDLGYVDKEGNPEMGEVPVIEIQIGPRQDNEPFQVLIDDLRMVPKAKKGKVMLQFDDGHISTHETVFPILQERGWPGTATVIPNAVGADEYMTEQMLREVADAGWDVIGHHGQNLVEMEPDQQKQNLQQVKQYLDVKGFGDGANHFVVPYHRVNNAALGTLDELFETAYLQGGSPNNANQPSNPTFISRVNGEDVRGARRIIDVAAQFNQLAVIYFHEVGDGDGWLPTEDFRALLDHIQETDIDVITPTQLTGGQ